MSWAGRQRAFIIAIAVLVLLAVCLVIGIAIFYETPTCTDKKQNQSEDGIDCGGTCSTLCAFQVTAELNPRFVRALSPQPGRTDVVAYVDNPNGNADAKDAHFLLEVYGTERQLIAKKEVTLDLPSLTTVPIYFPDVAPRGTVPAQAFLTPIEDDVLWLRAGERSALPDVREISIQEGERPRITATLINPLARPLYNTTLVAVVFDASGTVIAASQTLVPVVLAQGSEPLTFTWNAPFSAPVARVEILPVPKLGTRAP